MNRLFSLIRERARGKMADDSVTEDSAAEERIVEDSATDDAMVEKLANASSTTEEAIAEIAAVKELASGELVTAEVVAESRTVLEQSSVLAQNSVVVQSKVQSVTETIALAEDEESQEPLYGIVIHNDDKTTFDYVIHILTYYFLLSREMAEHIADVTHREGASLALLRPYEEAQYLIKIAHMKAELDGYPLKFSLEEPE